MPVQIEILNKTDLLSPDDRDAMTERARREPNLVVASALNGDGCAELLSVIDAALAESDSVTDVDVPLSDGAMMAWLYEKGEVLSREDDGLQSRVTVRLAPRDLARLQKRQQKPGQDK
jgi:GTP-binding protein HflX